jgi:hypothetical protein
MKTLGASVSIAGSMSIAAISCLSLSGPLAVSMSNVVTIGKRLGVVAISMVCLRDMDGCRSISMSIAISRLSISRPLAIAITMAITTIVSMQTLWASVCVAAASIRMVGNTSIARLSSSQAGKGYNNLQGRNRVKQVFRQWLLTDTILAAMVTSVPSSVR